MNIQQVSWIGKCLDGFLIKDQIGEGSFSWVYKAIHEESGVAKAVKIAKPADRVGVFHQKDVVPTEALAFITGGTLPVNPDPCQLLGVQSAKLRASSDSSLVKSEETVIRADNCHYSMELLEGQTLRERMISGAVSVSIMLELSQALQRLSADPRFRYHGDVKPENILITQAGIKLIDPGHFGPLDCAEGNLDLCIVTTPAYYPLLAPDDLFAVGIILWEAACKIHPMEGIAYSGDIDKSNLGQDLIDWVVSHEVVGRYYLSPILGATRPSKLRTGMPPRLESILLKALRLRIRPDNRIDRDRGFESFAELSDALSGLLAAGGQHL